VAIKDFINRYIGSGLLFEGTYGIEIEAESMDRQKTNTGRIIKFNSDHEAITDLFSFWDVKADGSLRNHGAEYVLKVPVPYGMVYETLQEFETKMSKTVFDQNSVSTSIHVHVNFLPETWKTLGNFLTIYTLTENLLIEYSGEFRRNNLFCLPIRSVPYVNKLCVDIFTNVQKKNYDFRRSLDINQIKYAALNLGCLYKLGSVELRSHKGVTDIDRIFEWATIINNILEFSRQDYTPHQILDEYKKRGEAFLRNIFGDEFALINHENIKQMLKDNLWYASNIGYIMTDDQWKGVDEKPEGIETEYSPQRLNSWSYKLYGIGFNELGPEYKKQVIIRIKVEDGRRKITGLDATPQPWQDVVVSAPPNSMWSVHPELPQPLTSEEEEYFSDLFNEEPE